MVIRVDVGVLSTQKRQKYPYFRVLDWNQIPLYTIMRVITLAIYIPFSIRHISIPNKLAQRKLIRTAVIPIHKPYKYKARLFKYIQSKDGYKSRHFLFFSNVILLLEIGVSYSQYKSKQSH